MNVSSCSCSNADNATQTNAFSGFRQRMQDFKGLANALQSGDLSGAQSAFDTLQKNLQGAQPNGKTSPLLDANTQQGKEFKALQDALKSGDVKGAQDAFETLKQDLRAAGKAHGHHHHRKTADGDNGSAATSTTGSTAGTLNVTA